MNMIRVLGIVVVFLLASTEAHAYVGPGVGLGTLGAIFGTMAAMFLAVLGLFWYPLKRMRRRWAAKRAAADPRYPPG